MINYRFLNYKSGSRFDIDLLNDKIPDDAIAFIQDESYIWARGKKYYCAGGDANVQDGVLTFKDGYGNVEFTITQSGGDLILADSKGNISKATYALKQELDNLADTTDSRLNSLSESIFSGLAQKVDTVAFENALAGKQDNLTAGKGIAIEDNVVSSTLIIDSQLSSASTNPVENKAIKSILDTKANTSDLDIYATIEALNTGLNKKQDLLKAGSDISIEGNVISTTLDTEVFVIVSNLSDVVDPSPNKIYLVEAQNADGTYRYQQYRLRNGQWVSFDAIMPQVNLTGYLKKEEADKLYKDINYSVDLTPYAKLTDIDAVRSELNDYAKLAYVQNNFQRKGDYATLQYVNDTFVRKIDVYTPQQGDTASGGGSTGGSTEEPIVTPVHSITVDTMLSLSSANPVENRAVTEALNDKANASELIKYATKEDLESKLDSITLDGYVTKDTFNEAISTKQNILSLGDGLQMIDDKLTVTLDTDVMVIVDELPVDPNPNKIYLVQSNEGDEYRYIEYRWDGTEWKQVGEKTPEIDLSDYLKTVDADKKYQGVGDYATRTEVANIYQEKGDYALHSDVDELRTDAEDTYQKKGSYALVDYVKNEYQPAGDYALTEYVDKVIERLQEVIDKKYVLKKDVYRPGQTDWSTSEAEDVSDVTVRRHNFITLTQAKYDMLVANGQTSDNTYYFTYEGEEIPETWEFGDSFPIILTGNWTFGGAFPITLS